MNHKLKLPDNDFKAAIITMLPLVIKNFHETDKKQKTSAKKQKFKKNRNYTTTTKKNQNSQNSLTVGQK